MKRRDFLKKTIPATLAPVFINNRVLSAFSFPSNFSCNDVNDRCLVIIQLFGGNDGLNTVVPIDQYADYINLRPTVGLDQSSLINLDNSLPIQNQIGLHPILTSWKDLYDSDMMGVIQGVGYPNHNASHFASTDLMNTGGDGTQLNSSYTEGWAAKYLVESYPGYAGNTSLSSHPLAIQIGNNSTSRLFSHELEQGIVLNLSGQDPSGFYSIVSGLGGIPPNNVPNSEHGDMIKYILDIQNNANGYSQSIQSSFNNGTNAIAYPDTNLADQLKTVARLISGGLKSKIYHVYLTGFDTHNGQVLNGAANLGQHAELLQTVSEAVKAFQDDLKDQGFDDRVLTATVSEFGRKIKENASFGTDHGRFAPMFLFGTGVASGVLGNNIDLSEANQNNNYQLTTLQYDYRQVWTSVVQDWLGACNESCITAFYDSTNETDFLANKVPVIDSSFVVDKDCYIGSCNLGVLEACDTKNCIYPNPAKTTISINSHANLSDGDLTIEILNDRGELIMKQHFKKNETINIDQLVNGTYYLLINNKSNIKEYSGKFIKI